MWCFGPQVWSFASLGAFWGCSPCAPRSITLPATASKVVVKFELLKPIAMASNPIGMASNLVAMAFTLVIKYFFTEEAALLRRFKRHEDSERSYEPVCVMFAVHPQHSHATSK